MRLILMMLLTCSASAAAALDYSDHDEICQAMEDNVDLWVGDRKETYRAVCLCHIAELEMSLEPDLFVAAVDFSIDARAFARNMPEDLDPTEFMGTMMGVGVSASKTCGSL